MSTTSWDGPNDPFKFSRDHYAPTVTTNSSRAVSSVPARSNYTASTFARSNANKYRLHPPRSDARSYAGSAPLTHASSLKSHPSHHQYRYYKAVESIPSSAGSIAPLPSSNLQPPKPQEIYVWYKDPLLWIKIVSSCFLFILFVLSLKYYQQVPQIFDPLLKIMHKHYSWGIAGYSMMLFVAILLLLPQTVLIVQGCVILTEIWGTARGILITVSLVWSINFVASILCYFYGRFLLYGSVRRLLQKSKILETVETAVFDIRGWKFVLLLRILPVNTYNVMNYMLGFTSLDMCALLISNLGMLPNMVLYCVVAVYCMDKLHEVLYISMIVEIIVCLVPCVWWILWIYYHVSTEYNQLKESVILSRPQEMFKQERPMSGNVMLDATGIIEEEELDDDVSDLY